MRVKSLVVAAAACLVCGIAAAQFGRGRFQEADDLPKAGGRPDAEFHMARLYFPAGGCAGSRGWCNPWWKIDYPEAEAHLLPAVERMTRIQVAPDSRQVRLDDDNLFDYPWLFLQQPGRGWHPQGDEALRLREYLERGGFLVVDDFHGEYEWASFRDAISDVLPGHVIVDIPETDQVLNILFSLDKRTQIPGERHLYYQRMEGPPHWRGIYDSRGRLMVAINHNSDMGDAWEHADDPRYPAPMTATAYRFGVNYVVYAMTH
jgi:hypothetical protein